jgi:hypothetical protein
MSDTQLPLATRCYVEGEARERALRSLDSLLDNDIGELDVDHEVDLREDGFPVVSLSGPDAPAARNVLRERWGEATPPDSGEVAVGTLAAWDEQALVLEAGGTVRVPREQLGLGPGDPDEIRTRYGLVQHMPLRFVGGDPPRLADAERDRLYDWTRGEGRVNVNSATRGEVRATVNRAGHARDIVTVERLGLLEQSIVCKPDTDPPGLLASIGEYLPAELLCVVP